MNMDLKQIVVDSVNLNNERISFYITMEVYIADCTRHVLRGNVFYMNMYVRK